LELGERTSLPPRLGWRTDGPPTAPSPETHRRQLPRHPKSDCPPGCCRRHQPADFPWLVGRGRGGGKPMAEADVGIGRRRGVDVNTGGGGGAADG
jgi:hypothetical protein